MSTTFIIIFLAIIFGITIYLRFIKNSDNKTKQIEEKTEEIPDFEKDFFAAIEQGEKSQLLVSLASTQDCMLLRSLLFAEGIPSHVEGEHMNNIYGGITGSMTSVVATKIYILCSDYDDAVEIITNSNISSLNGITIFEKVQDS